ncbi:glycyl radical protein [Clostridiales bacterium COT073_COT-073]|nr:glycyl radical protein [Clostridiales bacterium COT073_COT-073]
MEIRKLNERIERMRQRIIDQPASICPERGEIITKVYQEYEYLPVMRLRGKSLEEILKNMTIYIDEDTLLVGNQAKLDKAAPVFPEYGMDWMIKELDEFAKRDGDRFEISEESKQKIRDFAPYWENKTLKKKALSMMTEEARLYYDQNIIKAEGCITSGDGHVAMAYDDILKNGLLYYKEYAEKECERLDPSNHTKLKSYHFYQAFIGVIDAVIAFSHRYADLAENMAKQETVSEKRKQELLKMAEVCRNIPEKPATSFYEAVQFVWFIHLILQIESNGHSYSYGRLDQYLSPYYEKSLREGTITEEEALELLQNLCIKTLTINKIRSWEMTKTGAGMPLYQNITIGGQNPKTRKDAVNPVTMLILEAVGALRLPQPNLTVRYHKGATPEFMRACMAVVKQGFGMPAFNSDEIIIPSFIEKGIEEEDAYDYSAVGCVEVAVPGKWGYRCTGMSFINFPRTLLTALNNGIEPTTGVRIFEGTGHLKDMTSFEQVIAAWKKGIKEVTRASVIIDNCADVCLEEGYPDVLCSGLTENCLERGKALKEGGSKYDFISGLQVGIANLADSLAAIKDVVFERQLITPAELWEALKENFAGERGQEIQRMLKDSPHKYGNDDDYVDSLIAAAYSDYISEVTQYKNTRYGRGPIGGGYYAGTSSISANVPHGAATMATPDGRNAGEPLAEGCSPAHNCDINGPTAVFKSVSKLPTENISGGVLLNQKINPQLMQDSKNVEKLILMVRAFFDDLKGFHVQFNIVSRETLLDAQKHPDKHKDLIVRVAGYSAFFNALSKMTQDDIIARTEQSF